MCRVEVMSSLNVHRRTRTPLWFASTSMVRSHLSDWINQSIHRSMRSSNTGFRCFSLSLSSSSPTEPHLMLEMTGVRTDTIRAYGALSPRMSPVFTLVSQNYSLYSSMEPFSLTKIDSCHSNVLFSSSVLPVRLPNLMNWLPLRLEESGQVHQVSRLSTV